MKLQIVEKTTRTPVGKWMSLLACCALSIAIAAGCNGSNNGGANPNPTATTAPGSAFAGTYQGQFTGDATGTLRLTVSGNTTISGTLDTTGLRPQSIGAMAIYSGTGNVLTDGTFALDFQVGSTLVTFRGRLSATPTGVVASNLTWRSTNGQDGTFSLSRITPSPTGTPSGTPSATSTPSGTPSATGTPLATRTPVATATPGGGTDGTCNAGVGSATFSATSAGDFNPTAIINGCSNASVVRVNGRVISATIAFADAKNGEARSATVTITDPINGIQAGRRYTFGTQNIALYNETRASDSTTKQWQARTGNVLVNEFSAGYIRVTFQGSYGPATISRPPLTPGTGTFSLHGEARSTF
jgi:hypothetical protein